MASAAMNQVHRHTTADELLFVRTMYLAGKLEWLKGYLGRIHKRCWVGHGMEVDPVIIEQETKRMVDALERALRHDSHR
jgi:cytosine/adenosine deaminase-related metal-dependent hydrolase